MALFLISCLACVAVVAALLFSQFGDATPKRVESDITGYFRIDDLVHNRERLHLSLVCLIPLTSLFAVALYYSDLLAQGALSFAFAAFGIDYTANNSYFDHDSIPKSLRPIIVMLFVLWLFGGRLRAFQTKIEAGIIHLFQVRQQVNAMLSDVSGRILKNLSYQDAVMTLEESIGHRLRLPRELMSADDNERLSFHLLQLAWSNIRENGLHRAIVDVSTKYFPNCLSSEEVAALKRTTMTLVRRDYMNRVVATYLIVCIMYIGLVPLPVERIRELGVEWPDYNHIGIQLRELFVRTIGGILPIILAVRFVENRWSGLGKARGSVVYTVTSAVFLWCLAVNFVHIAIYLLQVDFDTGDFTWTLEENAVAGVTPEGTYVFGYAMAPAVTVLALVGLRPAGLLTYVKSVLGAILFGAGCLVSQMAFERHAGWDEVVYYWHQGFMGLILGLGGLLPAAGRRVVDQRTIVGK